jgi:putative zinc finger protein
MRCEELQQYVADHLAGTLPPGQSHDVAEHLRTCRTCADEIDGLTDTWRALGAIEIDHPESEMQARFDTMLDDYQYRVAITKKHGHVTWLTTCASRVAAAAAALVVGLAIGRLTAPSPLTGQLAMLRGELREMRQMMTVSLLQQPSASERLKGVSFTTQIDPPSNDVTRALLDTLMHDPSVSVRLATIDALKRFAASDAVRRGAIDALTRQTSPLVQLALIDFVVENNERDAADTLRRLVLDPMVDQTVRVRATDALQHIG